VSLPLVAVGHAKHVSSLPLALASRRPTLEPCSPRFSPCLALLNKGAGQGISAGGVISGAKKMTFMLRTS